MIARPGGRVGGGLLALAAIIVSWLFMCAKGQAVQEPGPSKFFIFTIQLTSPNSNPVSYWVTWQTNRELYTWTGQTVFTIFCFQKMFKIIKLVPQNLCDTSCALALGKALYSINCSVVRRSRRAVGPVYMYLNINKRAR